MDAKFFFTIMYAAPAAAGMGGVTVGKGMSIALNQVQDPTDAAEMEAFMVKPLLPELTAADTRRLFGIGTDRFLISRLDVT